MDLISMYSQYYSRVNNGFYTLCGVHRPTPIQYERPRAISRQHLHMMRQLKEDSTKDYFAQEVNKTIFLKRLPLTWHISENYKDAVEFLLQNGADVELMDDHGDTPLRACIASGNFHLIELLVNYGAKVPLLETHPYEKRQFSYMDFAPFTEGGLEFMKKLKQQGIKFTDRGWHFLLPYAIEKRSYEMFLFMLVDRCEDRAIPFQSDQNGGYFALAKHPYPEILAAFYEFGGKSSDLWKNSTVKEDLPFNQHLPLSLQSMCRLRIREDLGDTRLKDIDSLEVPRFVKDFLHYKEYIHKM